MKADMLFPILGSFGRACDVLAAATKNADGVSGSVASGLTAALQDTGACTATNPCSSSPISSSSSTSSHASQKHQAPVPSSAHGGKRGYQLVTDCTGFFKVLHAFQYYSTEFEIIELVAFHAHS